MKFWDSSAIIPLLVQEKTSGALVKLWETDSRMLVWWTAEVECVSALSRLERSGIVVAADLTEAFVRLQKFSVAWYVVQPLELLKETAKRLLRVHPLRAADALQLAAAIICCKNRPSELDFVCLDERLAGAAHREGFRVVGA